MTTPRAVLAAMLAADATRPRLTWYGPDGTRLELSAKVLANWVAKAANLLVEEGDVEPGQTLTLDLPPGHWRATYWALAAWHLGMTVRLDASEGADVAVGCGADESSTADPGPDAGLSVLVSLPMLARGYAGELPAGAIDEAAELSTYGDRPPPPVDAGGGSPALVAADGTTWPYAALVEEDPVPGARRHLDALGLGGADTLRRLLGVWAGGGSAVVTTGIGADALGRLLAAEGAEDAQG